MFANITLANTEKDIIKPFPFTVFMESYIPLFYEENGVKKGYVIDLLIDVALSAGYKIERDEIRKMPIKRGLGIVKTTKNTVLAGGFRLASRGAWFKWVGPIENINVGWFALKNRGVEIKHSDDVSNYRVGVWINTPPEMLKLAGVDEQKSEKARFHSLNFKKLVGGRVDLILSDEPTVHYYMNIMGLSPSDVEMVYPVKTYDLYFMFHRDTDDHLIARLNTLVLDYMEKSPLTGKSKMDKIKQKYFGN